MHLPKFIELYTRKSKFYWIHIKKINKWVYGWSLYHLRKKKVLKVVKFNMINNLKRKKRNTFNPPPNSCYLISLKARSRQNNQELDSRWSHQEVIKLTWQSKWSPHPEELACWGGTAFGIEVAHSKDMFSLLETSSDNSILRLTGLCILSLRKKTTTTNIFKRLIRI